MVNKKHLNIANTRIVEFSLSCETGAKFIWLFRRADEDARGETA